MTHVDYPHWPGTLYDCWACEAIMDEEELVRVMEDDTDSGETIVLDEELKDESF